MSEAHRLQSRNPVLQKDDVGKAKPSTFDLPADGYTFGRAEPSDYEGAKEVMMSWATHQPAPRHMSDKPDFRKLNRMAAKQNVTTVREMKEFRQKTGARALNVSSSESSLPGVLPSDVYPSFAYGMKCRPSTPISQVLGAEFSHRPEDELHAKTLKVMRQESTCRRRIKLNAVAEGRISLAKQLREVDKLDTHKAELFKLSKFKNVQSKLFSQQTAQLTADPQPSGMCQAAAFESVV